MKVTYNWLKDYVEIKKPPQVLAEKLTMAGLEVVSLEKFEDDWVLEVEVTTNRPDWLSVVGIAREISAITGTKLRLPEIKNLPHPLTSKRALKIKIEDKKACLRYVGRVIENVEVKPSPSWLQKRLLAVGLRPVNNVVDITNYCLLETGQPMHAFDYEKIEEGTIIVRRAKVGETIITIDGERRSLDNSLLIIADKTKPIALAGIMGGKDTEVSRETKTILLESAYFDPLTVRCASQKLGLITESSYRFERKVDLGTVLKASLRALNLIEEFASSREKIRVSKIKDIGRKEEREKLISLNPQRLNNFLGKEIPPSEIEKIFSRLGFSVRKKKDFFIIKPPLFRRDIEREEDLIEEIARLHGYEKIPLTFPESRKIPSLINEDGLRRIEKIVYEVLTGLGFNETITYSLVSRESLQKVNFQNEESWIKVSNPLSKAQEFLRPTLLVSLLEVVAYNLKHQKDSVKIFEWGKIYLVKETPREFPSLGLCLSGESFLGWLKKKEKLGFYTLKGVVETIFSQLGIKEVDFLSQEKPFFIPAYSAEIKFKGESLGFLGKIKEDIQNNFDLPLEAFFAEIDLTQLTKFASFAKRYVNLPKFPFILRDISFLVDAGINYGDLRKFFQEFPSPLIQEINLIDLYRGENIPAGKNSFTFSLKFQSPERTLREEEVEEVMREIRQGLKEKFSAEIR